MTTTRLSRPRTGPLLAALAALLLGAFAAPEAHAQRRGAQQQPQQPDVSKLLQRSREKDWTLKVNVSVHAYQDFDTRGAPLIKPLNFKTAAIVFPLLKGSASHETDTRNVKSELKFNDRTVTEEFKLEENYPAGTRLARWEMRDMTGREFSLDIEIPMTCWDTVFDEKAAAGVPWPSGDWPPTAKSTFGPQMFIDSGSEQVQQLVHEWTEGKDPKSIPPVTLAKFLAGRVLEHVQISGEGLVYRTPGYFVGLDLKDASQVAHDRRGSPHDAVNLLCAVYRAAGLPARTVIGYDLQDKKGGSFLDRARSSGSIRSWVEFCLYDEASKTELWVPVDIVRLRGTGSRVPPLDRPWKYFGTHDELSNVLPFAFQYHPPAAGVVAHRAVGFWGWLTTPTYQIGDQSLRFTAHSTPKRAGDRRRNEQPGRR